MLENGTPTKDPAYASRLRRAAEDPLGALKQLPYLLHVRSLNLGDLLDLGCGVGRNLAHHDGFGVGIDHNESAIAFARSRGLLAFTPDDFFASAYAERRFDSILCAHVAEHLTANDFLAFMRTYLPSLKAGGRFVLITPQRRGYATDATHVRFVDFDEQRRLLEALDLEIEAHYSFPFPAFAGDAFAYNEFVTRARKR